MLGQKLTKEPLVQSHNPKPKSSPGDCWGVRLFGFLVTKIHGVVLVDIVSSKENHHLDPRHCPWCRKWSLRLFNFLLALIPGVIIHLTSLWVKPTETISHVVEVVQSLL